MRSLKISLAITTMVVILPVLLAVFNQALASPLFSLETKDDWQAALQDGRIGPVPDPYPALEEHYGVYGGDYLYTTPELYVWEGDPPDIEGPGLVMSWGEPPPAADIPLVASWEYVYPEDPDLTGTLLSLTVMPPPGILSVSLTLNDAAGGWISWAWNVPGPWNPNPAPGLIAGAPNPISIDPTIPGPQAGANSFAMGITPFNPTIATTIQADELAVGVGGWVLFPPVPVVGGIKPWNYWSGLSISRPVTQVEIDIKPGSDPNAINPGSGGVIPVAILTTSVAAGDSIDFDATTVDPLTVKFGLNEATECHGKGHIEDVDNDGDLDMVLHFKTQDTGIQHGDTKACLEGKTFGGLSVKGCDAIVTVGKKAPGSRTAGRLTTIWGKIKGRH